MTCKIYNRKFGHIFMTPSFAEASLEWKFPWYMRDEVNVTLFGESLDHRFGSSIATGDVNGDLNHRRGRILGMGLEDGVQVITADVPQSELFRYAAELRSMTGGQGSFEMKFSRYDQVPANVAQKVVAATAKDEE